MIGRFNTCDVSIQADIITLLLERNLLQHVLTYISNLPPTLVAQKRACSSSRIQRAINLRLIYCARVFKTLCAPQ
jgi:hypothetical protein